ncbi:MAG: TonB-dependent receptor [Chthoniobacterales bacterium]
MIINLNRYLSRIAFATAIQFVLTFGLTVGAQAQTAAPNPAPGENPAGATGTNTGASTSGELQQVIVTGYLIPRVGEGPNPVTTYDQAYFQKTGYQNVQDVLQNLPAATGNFNPGVTTGFGFSPGGSSIALKGLPPNDTLVLVDGLRMPSYPFPQVSVAGAFNYVDINSIPIGAIDSVQILNDGGSAVYGTDAVAGVVNFITKSNYTGADIYNYYGISQRGDYEVYHGEFTGGFEEKFGRGGGSGGEPVGDGKTPPAPQVGEAFIPKIDVVAAFDYYTQSPVNAVDRRDTFLNYTLLSPKYPAAAVFPFPTGVFVGENSGNLYITKQGFNGVNPTPNDFILNNFTTQNPSSFTINGLQVYPREDRLGGLVKIDYQPTEWLKLYNSFLISRTEESSTYGPNQGIYPFPFNPGIVVPANNPYNPFHEPLQVFDLALNEFNVLKTDTTITTFRDVAGATIQLPHGWAIDGNWLYGESDGTETMKNMFFFNGMQEAMNGTLPGNEGQFFNPFADETVAGPNSAFYGNKNLVGSIWENIRSDIMQFHVTAGGAIWSTPAGDITVAGGFEYRSEDYIQNDDPNSYDGNLTAIQFPLGRLVNARRYIWSIFGQADIPILGGQWSFPGMRSLEFVMSERQDYYSDFGSAAKPKFSLAWKPINDLTLRASYSESFVAPSLPQLFTSAGIPAETTITLQNGQTLTVLNETLGNPRLKPENAYMYYLGAVWNPGAQDPEHSWWGWANGFSAYINWFQLDQHQVFGTLTAANVFDLVSAGVPLPAGNSIIFGPGGQPVEVTNTYLNLGDSRSEGIEAGLTYDSKEYSWGKIDLEFDASYLYWVSAQTVQGINPNGTLFYRVFNLTDTANGAAPDLKMQATAFYSKTLFGIDTFRTGFTLHYVGSEEDFLNSANGTNPNVTLNAPNYVHLIGSWTTLDWQISYKFGQPTEITPETPKPGYNKEGKRIVGEKAVAPPIEGSRWGWRNLLANTTITFGINNIFDTPAPLAVDNVLSNFDNAGGANFIQRYFWFSVDKKF